MNWKKTIINPLVITPMLGLILGNLSLGLVAAGLSVLIWGLESGVIFISLTTLLLVFLTGNINFEIIFIFVLSLAFFIREGKVFRRYDRKILFPITAVITLILYPCWGFILGVIPAGFLNEINIAGEILVITGLLFSLLRGRKLSSGKVITSVKVEYLTLFIASVLAVRASLLAIPIWVIVSLLIARFSAVINKTNLRDQLIFGIAFLMLIIASIVIILPLNFFVALLIIGFFAFIFWQQERVPLLEMVYLSFILGILAGKLGILS